jgi:error-prone DNA polymerase
VLVYPMNRPAYARLCRMLTIGKRRAGKGACLLNWEDLVANGEDLLIILIPDEADGNCAAQLAKLQQAFTGRAYMALTLRRRPNDQLRLHELSNLAAFAKVLTVVTNDVLYHDPERRMLQDVVTCIRHNCTIDDAGFRRERHADRYLKPPEEMYRLFARYPDAVARSVEILRRCKFCLSELAYQYPEEDTHPDLDAYQLLEKLTWEQAPERYPEGIPEKVVKALNYELDLIKRLKYAPYFLTVHSIVRFARSKDILCQGRGSAANSAVCYVLGITAIDPMPHDLLFERFISEDRNEPPDIDVDFEHQRREEVIQWIYENYGRDKAALCAVVTCYRAKGALRDVGKVLGLPEDLIRQVSSQKWGTRGEAGSDHMQALNINLNDRRLKLALHLAQQLLGTPRHHSQHPGGFVLTSDRLDELVPIEPASMDDRQIIEWDKDDIDIVKFMKMDCLALGMLSCMKRAFDILGEREGKRYELATIPHDVKTYEMISRADTLGTFQIESRAQMSMLPRLRPKELYDLVIQVAIVRPGPIQGDMVHPYLRRRQGLEPVTYESPELENILKKTLGVPLFQEQAMRIAIECAGFTPSEADLLRRAMATFKNVGTISRFEEKLIEGLTTNGFSEEFAKRLFKQLEGFGSYGFPESHAASFALVAYASAWMKCNHPDIFCSALLNSQPMGFYAPAQIVRDARQHGVKVLPLCINHSRWECQLEPQNDGSHAVRLGFNMVKGLQNREAAQIVALREDHPYQSIDDIWRRADVSASSLVTLAEADAFYPSLGFMRREALWAIKGLRDDPLPLFAAANRAETAPLKEQLEPFMALQPLAQGGEVVQDYGRIGLSLRQHPLAFLRGDFYKRCITTCADAYASRDGRWVEVAGLVLIRQRPGSAKGVMFMTIEDETGISNVVIWSKKLEQYRREILGAQLISVYGRIQREGEVVHLVAHRLSDLSADLGKIGERDESFSYPHGRGDEFRHGIPPSDRRTINKRAASLPILEEAISHIKIKSRDFK